MGTIEMTFYRQCTLTRGSTSQVAWIPETFAKQDKYLRIEDENGWQVVEVGSKRLSGRYLAEHQREYMNHRRVTDI